jgi:hypothetical protein
MSIGVSSLTLEIGKEKTKSLTVHVCAFAKLIDNDQAPMSRKIQCQRNLLEVNHECALNL